MIQAVLKANRLNLDQMAHANSAYPETFSPTQDTDIQDLEILQANDFEEPMHLPLFTP